MKQEQRPQLTQMQEAMLKASVRASIKGKTQSLIKPETLIAQSVKAGPTFVPGPDDLRRNARGVSPR